MLSSFTPSVFPSVTPSHFYFTIPAFCLYMLKTLSFTLNSHCAFHSSTSLVEHLTIYAQFLSLYLLSYHFIFNIALLIFIFRSLTSTPHFTTNFPFLSSFLIRIFCLTLPSSFFSSMTPTSSALRSCSTGDSLLSSAFIRSAKSAPALAPPLPVLLHHPLLPPLADQLAGTLSLHYLSPWKL